MDRAKFYDALRRRGSGVFGTSLSKAQVAGTDAILDACVRHGVTDIHHVSQILAHVYKETGGYMLGIKETVYPSHKEKNPSDATVIARLDRAWAKGQLRWVKTPYWRDGWFGRGPIQTTHYKNYLKMGTALGVDLIKHPEKLLEPAIGADSAVVGMSRGLYTGKKLSDYKFPGCLQAEPKHHPRRIVNGIDGTDDDITDYHWSFYNAIKEAGGVPKNLSPERVSVSPGTKPPAGSETASETKSGGKTGIAALIAAGLVAGAVMLGNFFCSIPIIGGLCG